MAVTITRSVWIDDDGTGQSGTVINQALHTTLYNEIDTALAKVAQLAGGNSFTVGPHSFSTGGVVRLLVDTTGGVLINSSINPASAKLVIAADSAAPCYGAIYLKALNAANNLTLVNMTNSADATVGSIVQNGATGVTYNTTSDARLKTDAGRATTVDALRAVVVHDFTWTVDGVRDRGVFAQEARAMYPRAVTVGTDETTDDGVTLARPWMTDYSKFVPDLIVGWQQHDAEIAELRAMFAAVKG